MTDAEGNQDVAYTQDVLEALEEQVMYALQAIAYFLC